MHLILTGVICFAMGLLACSLFRRARVAQPAKFNAHKKSSASYERLHRELLETKNHLQLLVESMSDGLITFDSAGAVVSLNHTAQKITGYDANSWAQLCADQIIGDCIERRTEYIDAREARISCADGKQIPIELSIRVVVTEEGPIFVATIKDISELKRAQKLMLQQAHIIEKSESFVFVTDASNQLEWCNPRFESLTGYTRNEVMGKEPGALLFCDSTTQTNKQLISSAISKQEPYNTEILLQNKEGGLFWAQIDAQPMLDDRGNLEKYVCLGADITDRKYADQMQVDFISMVSHELRTPLTVIAGAFEALTVNPRQRTAEIIDMMVEMGQRNCVRLEKLIEDLLDINKIESGTANLECEPLDINSTITACVQDISTVAAQSQIDLQFEPLNQQATMFADPLRVAQIMSNLLSNAIKFSSADSTVSIDVSMLENHVRIAVQDAGRGIPAEFWPMVFKKFSRDPGVEADGTDGFGLGLSICQQLVEQMHGAIDFESEEGVGTKFFFDLPLSNQLDSLPTEQGSDSMNRIEHAVT
jgi:PAS domain S-box-containing protein